ncbi:cyclic AMP-responsive element-binding protein 3-like protein 3-B isoform X2 [Aplysia californica]|uniref:Cyclic AMP-responsive element-binding protein 3-like protein 3-B isoform X2 n=1 Tax=Aplysia californica TaxID=6500 RepID=A0ABM1VS52_APLCA|nr:cyclic AMP-responsive element-binding protein 3-like protein 3-B isoform X2 [Aplysia californica]
MELDDNISFFSFTDASAFHDVSSLSSLWDEVDLDLDGDFDLLSDNLFESLINSAEPNSFLDGEPAAKKRVIHSDHDYIAHKSPSEHSDSGISVVSDDSSSALHLNISPEDNMTDDQLELFVTGNIKGSPDCTTGTTPPSSCGDSHTFDLFDVIDNNEPDSTGDIKHTHTVDTTTADLDDFDFTCSNDDNISIDFDLEPLSHSGVGSDSENHDSRSVFVFSGSAKRLIPSQKISKGGSALPFTVKDIDPHITSVTNFPELRLTDEEKELLAREGVTLPTNLPLTRDEERVLKAVRRKIRNKISAKESRKRKQGYVDGLEQRVKLCTQENRELQKKVDSLEKQNVSLIAQMKRLQSLVGKSKVPAQASTCVMVLLLSFALLVVPNLNPFGSEEENHTPIATSSAAVRGKARSLLNHDSSGLAASDEDPYGVTQRPSAPWDSKQGVVQMSALSAADIALAADDVLSVVKTEVETSDGETKKEEDDKKLRIADRFPELSKRIKSEPLVDMNRIQDLHHVKVGVENMAGGSKILEQNSTEENIPIDVEN